MQYMQGPVQDPGRLRRSAKLKSLTRCGREFAATRPDRWRSQAGRSCRSCASPSSMMSSPGAIHERLSRAGVRGAGGVQRAARLTRAAPVSAEALMDIIRARIMVDVHALRAVDPAWRSHAGKPNCVRSIAPCQLSEGPIPTSLCGVAATAPAISPTLIVACAVRLADALPRHDVRAHGALSRGVAIAAEWSARISRIPRPSMPRCCGSRWRATRTRPPRRLSCTTRARPNGLCAPCARADGWRAVLGIGPYPTSWVSGLSPLGETTTHGL